MDDKREGRPSFKTSDVVKNEVSDVIDGDRRLTVREIVDKCVISKTTVHEILVQELHTSYKALSPSREAIPLIRPCPPQERLPLL